VDSRFDDFEPPVRRRLMGAPARGQLSRHFALFGEYR